MHKKIKINYTLTSIMFNAILLNKGRDKPLHQSSFYFFYTFDKPFY
ncbi:hypothetical protein CLOBOL_07021 [Enterocloster bolteae ATCC BAA-613]|uniref:Uncharacterized protein n=1 Tax=Enterocloster bolteae (strain ATCC BAA-613 / DSM 15670 / CCUG 46953 / JCM 12243 / WAL 16351) TaxID=411902 RepID=A8S4M2_ENTBW|nr:hypothetical protein CLOBOL_07021 [Enterocloster bolteae ATCC BAA-613]